MGVGGGGAARGRCGGVGLRRGVVFFFFYSSKERRLMIKWRTGGRREGDEDNRGEVG